MRLFETYNFVKERKDHLKIFFKYSVFNNASFKIQIKTIKTHNRLTVTLQISVKYVSCSVRNISTHSYNHFDNLLNFIIIQYKKIIDNKHEVTVDITT